MTAAAADYATARRNMVDGQLRPSRIAEPRLLAAMGSLPRERFVPERMRGVAYADEDIPLGGGRFLVEPLALGKLVQGATVRPQDKALVAGDPTGYAAAVVSRLAAAVHLLLPVEVEADPVRRLLEELGCRDVTVHNGETLAGLPAHAPFDAIVLVGAVEGAVPQALLGQLAEGGRLAAVVEERHFGRVVVHKRIGDAYGRSSPFDAGLPPLPDLPARSGFEF